MFGEEEINLHAALAPRKIQSDLLSGKHNF